MSREHALEGIYVHCIHVIGEHSVTNIEGRQACMCGLSSSLSTAGIFRAEINTNTKSECKKHPFIVLGMISKELQVCDKRNNPQRVRVRNRQWELESYVHQVTRNPGKL